MYTWFYFERKGRKSFLFYSGTFHTHTHTLNALAHTHFSRLDGCYCTEDGGGCGHRVAHRALIAHTTFHAGVDAAVAHR